MVGGKEMKQVHGTGKDFTVETGTYTITFKVNGDPVGQFRLEEFWDFIKNDLSSRNVRGFDPMMARRIAEAKVAQEATAVAQQLLFAQDDYYKK